MKNCIYIIYGKTIDGRDIALDGYKVESFANYHCDRQGIMEIVFRSGQTARMAEDDDLQSKLVESMQVDKKTKRLVIGCAVRKRRDEGGANAPENRFSHFISFGV